MRRRPLFLEMLEDRRLLAAEPTVTLSVPGDPFIGTSPLVIQATFDNTSATPTDVGYGPFIDIVFPRNGADGAAGTDTPDGISPISGATYLGVPITTTQFTFPDDGFGTGCVAHPYAVDNTNTPLQVCGTAGDVLVVVQLPFGSFTPDQPPATIELQAELSNFADLGVGLPFTARGGFQFGLDPLNNPSKPDPTVLPTGSDDPDSSTWAATATTTPTVIRMTKTYVGPEDETATGPNFPRQYVLTVSIAPGQTVTDLDIVDGFDNNIVVTGITAPSGATNVPATPFGPANFLFPSQALVATIPTVTGTGGSDVQIVIDFYVPEFDASGDRIIPLNGEDDTTDSPDSRTLNDARAQGDWTPLDPRDVGGVDNAVAEPNPIDFDHILDNKSLAIQKSVSVVGGGDAAPGRVLEYTLSFQISDYYTFGDLFITDTFSDGQDFFDADNNLVFIPTFAVTDRQGTTSGQFVLGDTVGHAFDGAPNATETLVFNVSKALRDALGTNHADGILIGGLATADDDYNRPPENIGLEAAAVGTVTFRVLIPNDYDQSQPAGNIFISQGDSLANGAWIEGTVRNNGDTSEVIGTEDDDTAAGVSINYGFLQKSIFAVNGESPPPGFVLAPGDSVTYCLVYTKPITSFNNLVLRDFLPLPVFNVLDPLADGTNAAWQFNDASKIEANRSTPPPAGYYQFGPFDTLYDKTLDSAGPDFFNPPEIDVVGVGNSLTFTYGSYDSGTNTEETLHILFTITVNDSPFADGLFLTNIVRAFENNSNLDESIEDAIVQIRLGQPALNITKGVVGTDHPAPPATFVPVNVGPAGVTFNPPGLSPSFTGIVTSDGLAANPIDSNLTNIDAGNLVRFAIVVENTGSSRKGAFDVRVRDTLPAGFAVPSGGLNLSVTDGTGASISFVELGGTDPLLHDLFEDGIELVDPGPTLEQDDGTDGGALDQYSGDSGQNILVITYDLIAETSVQPNETIVNTATLTAYAGVDGGVDEGANHVPPSDQPSDDASVTISPPSVDKTVLDTNQPHTTDPNVAIGEIITYQVVVTVPEGTTSNAVLVDVLDSGLAFVDVISIEPFSGGAPTSALSTSIGEFDDVVAAAVISPVDSVDPVEDGCQLTLNFGTITNTNTDDTAAETLVITYRAVVLNTTNNNRGDQRNNLVVWSWEDDFGPQSVQDSAPDVTIVEPTLFVFKEAAPLSGEAGDTITFTIEVRHVGVSNIDAFDVLLTDLIPAHMTYVAGSLAWTGVGVGPDELDDSASPLTVRWDRFPDDTSSFIRFDVTLDTTVTPGQVITNEAVVTYTSLPGDVTTPQSIHNGLSTERTGNPANPGGAANDYLDRDPAIVTVFAPQAIDKTIVATSEFLTPNSQVAIGEIVRYRLRATVIEGTNPGYQFIDTLPAGLAIIDYGAGTDPNQVRVSFVSDTPLGADADLLGANGGALPPTHTMPSSRISVATVGGQQRITFDFGTLINTDDDANEEFVDLDFNVLVLNTGDTNAGDVKTNSLELWTGGALIDTSAPVDVTIVEPLIDDLTKEIIGAPPLDAGDLVTFRLTHSNTGTAAAFDIRVLDVLDPAYFTLVSPPVITSECPAGVFVDNSGGNTIDVTFACLGVGMVATIEYTAILTTAVEPGQVLENIADLWYTSLPGGGTPVGPENSTGSVTPGGSGDSDGERDGSGGVNDYTDTDSETLTIQSPVFSKTLTATNQTHTAGLDVAIGEIVTYQVVLTVPEGTMPGAVIVDSPDAGLAIVAVDSITSNNVALVTSVLGGFEQVRTNANASIPLSGNEVTFNFATLTNTDTDNNSAETITIVYRAVVLNTAGNIRDIPPVTLDNEAVLTWSQGTLADAAEAVTVVEPTLAIDKLNGAPATGQAGDVITFQILVQHTAASNADAFEVQLVDLINSLPNKMTYVPASLSVVNAGTPAPTLAPGSPSDAGGDLNMTWSQFPLGGTSTITFQVTLDITVNPEEILTNTGNLTWTSLPGDVTAPQSSNPHSVERTGTPSVFGELHNYQSSDSGIVTILSVDPTKAIVETSEPHTLGTDVAVGEIVRYRLQTSLIEGTTPALRFVDTLPAGLILLDLDQVLVSFTSHQPMDLEADLSPPNPDANNSQVPPTVVLPSSRIVIVDQTITFNLGDVVNNDNDADLEFVTLEFNALVTNTTNVNNGEVKSNTFRVFVNGAQFGPTSSVDVTVREPSITDVSKTVLSSAPVDAGDAVEYQVSFSNTGATTAFDVRLLDELDPIWFHSVSVDSITLDGGALGPITDSTAGTTVEITVASVPVGGTVVVRYTAILSVNVQPGETIPNVADVTYTSLPGNGTPLGPDNLTGSITPGGSGAANGERDGSGGVNDYADTDNADVTLTGQSLFAKSLAGSNQFYTVDPQLTIGEQATYTLVLTIPEGTLPGVFIADTLPAGLALVAFVSITPSSAAIATDVTGGFAQILADANDGLVFDDTSFVLDFGTLTNWDTDDLETETLTVTYRAVVLDVPANVDGESRTNAASFTWDGGTMEDDVTIDLVEPDLTIIKDTNVTEVDGGDTVTFTITVDHSGASTAWALDVTVYDTLPAGLTYVAGSVAAVSGPAPTVSVLGPDLAFSWAQFPLGDGPYIFTFAVTVDASITPWTTFENFADVEWSTLPGADPDERTYMDYDAAEVITSSTRVDDPRKNMIVTSEAHTPDMPETLVAIGEIVRYRLQAELTEGTFPNLVFVDTLPPGLSFLDAGQVRVSFVSNVPMGLAGDLAGASNNAVPPTFVLPPARIVGGPGGELRFLLGTVTNNDNDLDAELVVLEFNVLVDNTVGNAAGQIRTNEFRVLVDDVLFGDPQSVDVQIVEPRIEDVSKQFVSMAGNQRTFEVSFSNTGTTTAFDAQVTDIISAAAALNVGSIAVTLGGGATGVSTAGSTPGLLQVTIGRLPVGGTVVVRYTVTLTATYQTGLLNDARVTYTSLPGPNGTTTNPTGSSTPGNPGDTNGERNGSGVDANDYLEDDNETLGSLGDLVWYDMNANGLVDLGEPGLPNVDVTAVWAGPDGIFGTADDVTLTTTTNASGIYFFNALPPGPYRVTVDTNDVLPLIATYDLDGGLDSTTLVSLGVGQNRVDVDFGYTQPSTITGLKFRDDNGNGVRDGLEPPLAGVRVYVDANNNGAFDAGERSAITDAAGVYTIGGLLPGTYIVRELRPDNTVQTAPAGNGAHAVVIVVPGTTVTDIDFGNRPVPPQIIDDGDPNFVIQGDWVRARCWIFLQGDAQYLCSATPGTGSNYVEWQFTGLTAGATYRVSTTWYPASGLSQDAPYTVFGGAVPVTAVFDQTRSPTVYDNSFRDQGVWWADVSAAYTLTGTTLVVRLADDHSGGCLLADAVRIIQETTPEISVLDGGADLTSGTSVVDLGSTVPGTPLPRTFTVRNDGGAPLTLGTLTLPDGYRLDVPLGLTTLTPGQTTSFTVQLDAVALGTYAGVITLGNDDNDEAPFAFSIVGVVGSVYDPNPQPAAPLPVVLPTVPLMDVVDGANALVSGLSTIDWGTLLVGDAANRVLTVTNRGSADLLLGTILVPSPGFSVSPFGDSVLAPGESTTFTVSLDTSAAGTFSGDLIIYDASNQMVFTVGLSGVVELAAQLLPPLVLDNGQGVTGFVASGMTYVTTSGYEKDIHYTRGDYTGDYAEWTFTGLPSGTYLVSTTYVRGTSRASNAPYTLTGVTGGPTTVLVNQQLAPDDLTWNGVTWEHLGTFEIIGGTLTVRLTDNANGYVYADAIRVAQLSAASIPVPPPPVPEPEPEPEPEPPPPPPPPLLAPLVLDNGRDVPGFVASGMTYVTTSGYEKDTHYTRGDNTGDFAEWTFTGLPSGTYLVSTTYVRGTSRASNAPYTLTGVTGGPTTVLVNQQLAPADLTWNGVGWKHLGTFQVTSGTLTVRLTDNANGFVYADAVRVEQLSPLLGGELAWAASAGRGSASVAPFRVLSDRDLAWSAGAGLGSASVHVLTQAAIERWMAADAAATGLAGVHVRVADLPPGVLGLAARHSQTIWVDLDADGQGWFLDATPWADEEFVASFNGQLVGATAASRGGVDLLSVLAHELGHLLGHADDYDAGALGVMAFALPPGVRRLPRGGDATDVSPVRDVAGGEMPLVPLAGAVSSGRPASASAPRTAAGLVALLAEQPAPWALADEEVARLTALSRRASADPEQRLDEVLSSVGDWLDPLDELLSFARPSR